MAEFLSFSDLSNRDLLDETMRLAGNERSSTAKLVAALREVDSRRLYRDEGYSCMFFYCTDALRLSESAAYRRIEVARVSRAFPQVLEAAASFKKRKEVERVIAERHPKPDVPAVIRKQPARRASGRRFLEFHHVVPYAAGGKATVDNIALRCKAHNGHEAVLYFGEDVLPRRAKVDS